MRNNHRSNESQQPAPLDPRIHRKCEVALAKAIDAFPELLACCDETVAAKIVADLIKFALSLPASEEKGETLQDIIQRVAREREEQRVQLDSEQAETQEDLTKN